MIVKNEGINLRMSVPSFLDEVDELIIVDTGSTDDTLDAVREFQATHGDRVKLEHFEWCDDFAAARNYSISKATGDWIVWFDADEVLNRIEPGAIRRLAQMAPMQLDGYLWLCKSQMDEVNVVQSWQWRMFPNWRGTKFQQRLHETPMLAENRSGAAYLTQQLQASTSHWGYLNMTPELIQVKAARNGKILAEILKEDPGNFLMRYYYGNECRLQNQTSKAGRQYLEAIRLWKKQGSPPVGGWLMHSIYAQAATMLFKQGKYSAAIKVGESCPDEFGSCELVYVSGLAYIHAGKVKEGASCLTRAWSDPLLYCDDRSVATWRPLLMLASLYQQNGQYELGRACLQKAMILSPDNPEIARYIGQLEGVEVKVKLQNEEAA